MDTRIDEIAPNTYRIATDVQAGFGGFSFNRYLITGDRPLLWHAGNRGLFESTRDAIAKVMPVEKLAFISFAHVEGDETGALNELLAAAPNARPLCGRIAAMTSIMDMTGAEPHVLADGETVDLGCAVLRWIDAPHVPHGWENGYLFDQTHNTLFCGDLFTTGGAKHAPLIESDILGPSEAFRAKMDYFAHAPDTSARINGLAALQPKTLALMHGSAWRGDGGAVLRDLAGALAA